MRLGDGWLLNTDVKKVRLATDVSSFGNKLGNFAVGPLSPIVRAEPRAWWEGRVTPGHPGN